MAGWVHRHSRPAPRSGGDATSGHADALDQLGLLNDALRRVAEAVGNAEACDAALTFGTRWSRQLDQYAELIAALRTGLELAATAYEHTDQDNAGQLREYVRYRNAGWPEGQPADDLEAYRLWNDLHTASLEDYGISEQQTALSLPPGGAGWTMSAAGDSSPSWRTVAAG
jgi:hypothetical protein